MDGLSEQGFKENIVLSRMVVGGGVEVSISVSFLPIDPMGVGAIKKVRDEDI